MKKIIIFTHNLGQGGIEKYTCTLANCLVNDYAVEIMSSTKVSEIPSFYVDPKVKITYLIDDRFDLISIKQLILKFKIISVINEIKRRRKLKKLFISKNKEIIEKLECDIVITTRISLTKLVNKYITNKNIKLIATDHNFHNYDKKYYNELINSLTNFHYLVVATDELYNFYKDKIGNTKCVKIPNTIDFMPNVRSDLKQKNLISIGRFSEEKGFLDLIDVFNIVHKADNQVKLYLIGEGHQRKKIMKKINRYKLTDSVIMPGFIRREEQYKYYNDSSLYIMTSLTEAFGLVLIESMSYGVPCIAFDSANGAKELLKESGFLIKNRDKKIMASKIIELLSKKNELIKYQKKSQNLIKNFTIDKFKSKWTILLKI